MKIYDMLLANALMGEGGGGGGGDLSTAQVTLVKGDTDVTTVEIPNISEVGNMASSNFNLTETTATVTALLYKGAGEAWSAFFDVVEVEGNATIDDGVAIITGDCTVIFGRE